MRYTVQSIVLTTSFLALVPFSYSPGLQLWDINIGVLYITAVSSISVIGVMMAGWASNNKYSLLGAMRSGAQIVSYELSVGMSLIAVIAMSGSLSILDIINSQADGWWIYKGHIPAIISFMIFIIASTAELNRAPFDLAEAEQELTAGFHTEYSYAVRHVLPFGIHQYADRFDDGGNSILRRLATALHSGARRLQCCHGLYTGIHLVLRKSILCGVPDHVVPLDISPYPYRPATSPGMEIPPADQYCQCAYCSYCCRI